jgi:hypothetical protein
MIKILNRLKYVGYSSLNMLLYIKALLLILIITGLDKLSLHDKTDP